MSFKLGTVSPKFGPNVDLEGTINMKCDNSSSTDFSDAVERRWQHNDDVFSLPSTMESGCSEYDVFSLPPMMESGCLEDDVFSLPPMMESGCLESCSSWGKSTSTSLPPDLTYD